MIRDVRTEVHNGTLEVTFHHDGILGSDVVVDASVPTLTGIDVSGSGDVDADGIDADAFALRSDGSADIALRGRVRRLAVDVSGSGDADLSDLARSAKFWGYVGAGIATAAIVGTAIAASNDGYYYDGYRRCGFVRQFDAYGNYIGRVRTCGY